jgi:PAS domain S-box-containing protein
MSDGPRAPRVAPPRSGAQVAPVIAEIVEGTAHTGQAFFDSLVLCLSRALGTRWALVGELCRPAGESIQTLGFSSDGVLQPAVEYALAGTPCADVIRGEVCYYPSRVADLFPADTMLRDIGAESYLGVPLRGSSGAALGLLVVLHDRSVQSAVDPADVLHIFGARAAAELERLHHERELLRGEQRLHQSEERLRSALEAARMGAWEWDVLANSATWSDRENGVCGFAPGTTVRTFDDYLAHVHAEDVDGLREAVGAAVAGARDSYVCEHRVRLPDGTYRWIEGRGKMFRDAAGLPARLAGTIADIDDRKRTEQELRAGEERLRRSEEMFSKIFRASPAAIVIAKKDAGGFVDVNDATLEMTGFRREEVLGQSGLSLGMWSPAERSRLIEAIECEGRIRNAVVDFTTPRGLRSMLLSAEILDISGEAHYLVMAQDLTERLQAEKRLQQSEERWRRLSEAAFEGICIAHQGRILDINDRFAQMFGYSPDELIGMSVLDLAAPESREKVLRNVQSGLADPYEAMALRKDGARVPMELRARNFTSGDRDLRVTVVRDMTERKRFEADLRAAAREWNECFDAMPVGLVIADGEGRIRRVNRRILEWSEAARFTDLLGRPLASVGAGEPWARLMTMACSRGAEGATDGEVRDLHTGKAWRIAWSEFPSHEKDDPCIVLVVRDVTETARLRDDLRRQETLASIGSLAAGVAHEVRTPLFSISATIDAFENGTPEEVAEGTRLLRAQVRRLSNVMRDLLDYGKPPLLQLEIGGIGEVAERALRACEPLARDAGVTLRQEVASPLPDVRRDARRLEQAVQNLVANAIQHSPAGSAVWVVVAPVGREPSDHVECRVEDSGAGIPEENLARIFEPFFSRRKGGTGLGLSIVQRIVEAHGGAVGAANRLNGGAVFTVTLPAARPAGEVRRV